MEDETKTTEQTSSESPASEQPAPTTEQPAPSSEQPTPASEEPTPASEEPIPASEQPTPNPFSGKGDDITPNTDGGVLKSVVKEGSGDEGPMEGDTVYVHYVGTLLDGTLFDSSRNRGQKFSFKLGKGEVIKGWDIGVATMKRDEVSVFTCKPEYAYGKRAQGKIPPNSTLVFEVELFNWTGEDVSPDKDGSIIKRVMKSGEGIDNPTDDSTVEVSLIGRHEGRVFDEREVSFIIGECVDHNIIEGVEVGITKMQKGETCKLMLKPKFAFGAEGNKEFNIPPDSSVEYEITLTSFEKAKESWELQGEEKISAGEVAKAKGTKYFKAGKFQDAIKHYKRVVSLLDYDTDLSDEQKTRSKPVLLAGHLNLAMAYIKVEEYIEAINSCDKALEIDESSVKGLFRRGQSKAGLRDWELAKEDFEQVLEVDPSNKAAKNQVAVCVHHIKQDKAREKKMYSNMFSKYIQEVKKPDAPRPPPSGEDVFATKIEHFNGQTSEGGNEATASEDAGGDATAPQAGDATATPAGDATAPPAVETTPESAQPMES